MVSRVIPPEAPGLQFRSGGPAPLVAMVEACGFHDRMLAVGLSDELPPQLDDGQFGELPVDVIARYFGVAYPQVECHRSDVAMLGRFANGIELASVYLCMAFEVGGLDEFEPGEACTGSYPGNWLGQIADVTFSRFATVRRALLSPWTPPAAAEPLIYAAFFNLCEVVPEAAHSLKPLFQADREEAIRELVGRLDARAGLIRESLELSFRVSETLAERSTEADAARLQAVQVEILRHAGESLSLTDAATALGVTRQAVHKRIGKGSALGVMLGNEIVVPSIQFVERDGGLEIVPGLREVMDVFTGASTGHWTALQYLVERDPMLAGVPFDLLLQGEVDRVVQAARAYLGVEGA